MRFHVTPAIRSLVGAIAIIASTITHAEQNSPADVIIQQHTTSGGDQYFALALRPTNLKSNSVSRHAILVDTSASQIGTVRESTLQLVQNVVAQLGAAQVQIFAVDVDCQSLTSGFTAGNSQVARNALKALELRTPLGTTDMQAALQSTLDFASSTQPTSVLYIGDGFSANRIPQQQLSDFADALVAQKVSVHSLVLGPRTSSELPAILANLTGGTTASLVRGSEKATAVEVSSALRVEPTAITVIKADSTVLSPASSRTALIRPDRHTVVLGTGEIPAFQKLTAATADGDLVWMEAQCSRDSGGAELVHIVNWSAETDGINVPIVDVHALKAATTEFSRSMRQSIGAARNLSQKGQTRQAREILDAAARMDDSNHEVRIMLTSLLLPRADENVEVLPALQADTNPGVDGFGGQQGQAANPLNDTAAKVALQSQILAAETNAAIDQANQRSAEDPVYATNLLKGILETIQASADISPDIRAELERRVIAAIGDVQSRLSANALQQKQIARDAAIQEAQKRLLEEEHIAEDRLEIQIEMIRGLLDRGRHGDLNAFEDAEFESRITLNQKPGSGPATQALVMSEALGQLSKAYQLINLRHDRFLEVLYQVELSHVPFPDEPPILYPPADVWRALTLTRKPRYESSDLRSEAPVEKWLRQMLDKPVRNLDFPGDVPLSEILDTIESYFTATYGAGVGASGTDFKMTIYPDKGELALEQITSLEDITISDISFDGMSLRNALKLIFDQTNDDTKSPVPLTYIIQNEVMMITTKDKAESADNLVTRVYPVADLVIPPSAAQQLGGGGQGGQQGGGFGGGGGQQGGGFGGGGGQQGGFGGGGGGGFMSIPPEAVTGPNGISADAVQKLKKKPILN